MEEWECPHPDDSLVPGPRVSYMTRVGSLPTLICSQCYAWRSDVTGADELVRINHWYYSDILWLSGMIQ